MRVFLGRRVAVRIAKKVVLEFGRGHYAEAALGGGVQLLAQDRAGGHGDELVRHLRLHVAQHDGRAIEPAGPPERSQVGGEVKVAVALLPIGEVVAGNGFHFHVDGQQVIAGMRARFDNLRDEILRLEPLAHQPAVEIGKHGQNRIDFARSGQLCQFAALQKSHTFAHQRSPFAP